MTSYGITRPDETIPGEMYMFMSAYLPVLNLKEVSSDNLDGFARVMGGWAAAEDGTDGQRGRPEGRHRIGEREEGTPLMDMS